MPFIDSFVSTIEKEGVPLRGKFRQGFYDVEASSAPTSGVDYLVEMQDSDEVKQEYEDKGFQLPRRPDMSSWYLGFNMLDPVIGKGDTPEQRERTASCARPSRSPSTGRSARTIFPQGRRRDRDGPVAAAACSARATARPRASTR